MKLTVAENEVDHKFGWPRQVWRGQTVNIPPLRSRRKWLYETRIMPTFSIRLRLIFLSVLLLSILAGSSALLIRELIRDSRSLSEEAKLVWIVRDANSASKHFGDLKYWAIDSAVTQLAGSQ